MDPLTMAAVGRLASGFWGWLKSIPWQGWLALTVFAIACYAAKQYGDYREDKIRHAWDQSIIRGRKELDRLKAERAKITVQTEKVYVDRIRVVREKGQTIVQRVPAYVPADACVLPIGFRVLHDAAASGTVPPATDSADADASQAETIAWRPWDSRAGAAGGGYGGRKLLTRE